MDSSLLLVPLCASCQRHLSQIAVCLVLCFLILLNFLQFPLLYLILKSMFIKCSTQILLMSINWWLIVSWWFNQVVSYTCYLCSNWMSCLWFARWVWVWPTHNLRSWAWSWQRLVITLSCQSLIFLSVRKNSCNTFVVSLIFIFIKEVRFVWCYSWQRWVERCGWVV